MRRRSVMIWHDTDESWNSFCFLSLEERVRMYEEMITYVFNIASTVRVSDKSEKLTGAMTRVGPGADGGDFSEKLPKKTSEQRGAILEFMLSGGWYKAVDINSVLDIGERRLRDLLRSLVQEGRIEETGNTKGKRYRLKK